MSRKRAPADLTTEARRLWNLILADYELEPSALAILEEATRALMRLREAQSILDRDGILQPDRFGINKPHPATVVERDSRMAFLRCVRALNLEIEPESFPT